jgi:hypothetical protein
LSFRMPPATARKSLFECDVDGTEDCGAGGNSLGGCVDCRCLSPLSGVFRATHVKPENRPSGLDNNAIKAVKRRCVGCSGTIYMEVLQLCRSGWISWAAMVLAPLVAGLFKWR